MPINKTPYQRFPLLLHVHLPTTLPAVFKTSCSPASFSSSRAASNRLPPQKLCYQGFPRRSGSFWSLLFYSSNELAFLSLNLRPEEQRERVQAVVDESCGESPYSFVSTSQLKLLYEMCIINRVEDLTL